MMWVAFLLLLLLPAFGQTPSPAASYRRLGGPRRALTQFDLWYPRGNLTFAGVVLRVTPETVTVRTRHNGVQTFVLRNDTFYLGDGLQLDLSNLKKNTCVFIRAGRNFEEDLEAYQIVWGSIVRAAEPSY